MRIIHHILSSEYSLIADCSIGQGSRALSTIFSSMAMNPSTDSSNRNPIDEGIDEYNELLAKLRAWRSISWLMVSGTIACCQASDPGDSWQD
jgi:hypothetical protein